MNSARILRHLLTGHLAVRRLFPVSSLTAIEHAIKQSETSHGGEVCFAVEPALNMPPLLRGQSARERAVEVFSLLRVWDTELNNGVLIYLLLADHDVEIIADRGIDAKVGGDEWERICREMEAAFRQGQFESGVIAGIRAIGSHLQRHFQAGSVGGGNELPDKPVIL
jgi:uncharacterized membrane protein